MVKVSIIGAGNLGSFIAYETASRGLADEIVLVDILADMAEGHALDIQQSLPFKNRAKVHSGNYDKIAHSDIIIITAGKPRTPDIKDRLDLAAINIKIMKTILDNIQQYSPNSIVITITNPLDIMNHFVYTQQFSREKVIGSGGQLDSARFRTIMGFPSQHVDGFVLGEHGESQIPLFSRILNHTFSNERKQEINEQLRKSSMKVLEKKGTTVYAPGSNTVDMVEAILKNQQKIMICSANLEGEYGLHGVSLGVPVLLGRKGIERVQEWVLDASELRQLQEAGRKLKEVYHMATKSI